MLEKFVRNNCQNKNFRKNYQIELLQKLSEKIKKMCKKFLWTKSGQKICP